MGDTIVGHGVVQPDATPRIGAGGSSEADQGVRCALGVEAALDQKAGAVVEEDGRAGHDRQRIVGRYGQWAHDAILAVLRSPDGIGGEFPVGSSHRNGRIVAHVSTVLGRADGRRAGLKMPVIQTTAAGCRIHELRIDVVVGRAEPDLAVMDFIGHAAKPAVGNPRVADDAMLEVDRPVSQIVERVVAPHGPLGIAIDDRVGHEVFDQPVGHPIALILRLDTPSIARDGGMVDTDHGVVLVLGGDADTVIDRDHTVDGHFAAEDTNALVGHVAKDIVFDQDSRAERVEPIVVHVGDDAAAQDTVLPG